MSIPYRTRSFLKRLGILVLVVAVVASLALVFWFIWLQRFVIYTRDQGAILDLTAPQTWEGGVLAVPPEQGETVPIYYNEGANALNVTRELGKITGYYADRAALEKNIDAVIEQVKALPRGTTVMLDVKTPKGAFYYSSSVAEHRSNKVDPLKMDELIQTLDRNGGYLIARLPALRDYHYGRTHVRDGVPTAKGYLWVDRTDGYFYWLNPAKQGTQTYLLQIISELRSLGFDEVVLDDFRIPVHKDIVFNADRAEVLAQAAQTLVNVGSTETFTVSFVKRADSFTLPNGRCRLYLEGVSAAQADSVAQQTGITDPAIRVAFLTEVHDTRFDAYSVLRPLEGAH